MVANNIQNQIQKLKDAGKSVVNLSFADFTFYPSLLQEKKIQSAFRQLSKHPYYYPVAQGDLETRQSISKYYQDFGQEISPEQILLTSGINQSYLYLFKIFSAEKGEILVPNPHPPMLEEIASFLGIKLIKYDLDPTQSWQINLDSLKAKISAKTRAIFLMSPHLPTGAIQSDQTLTDLFALLKKKNIVVVSDESLSDFVFNKINFPIIQNLSDPGQLIISLQSLSNGFALPGLQLSWLTFHGPKAATQTLMKATEYLADTFLTLSQISQTIAPEIISGTEKWRYKFQQQVEKNRNLVCKKLAKVPGVSFQQPAGGLFALIQVPQSQLTAEELVLDLLKNTSVYVHPGSYYGLAPEKASFVICFLQDPSVLSRSIKHIIKYFKRPDLTQNSSK
jgi:aspartate/methionine/tyrosine aminotransferase